MDRILFRQLREEILDTYAGSGGRARLAMFLSDELGFNFYHVEDGDFAAQVHTTLTLLRSDGRIPDLLDALVKAHPGVMDAIRASFKAAMGAQWPDAEVRARHRALGEQFLICAGLPFVDRKQALAGKTQMRALLDDLFDPTTPARVGVVTGVDLCGKTWSRNLVKQQSKLLGYQLVELDLENDAASDDPKSLCETLLNRLRGKDDIRIGEPDTKPGQFGQRLVEAVITHRNNQRLEAERRGDETVVVIVIDSLNKNVGAPIMDFVEQLIQATRSNLNDTKLLLFGFPREIERFGMFVRPESLKPLTADDIDQYFIAVGNAVGRAMTDGDRGQFVQNCVDRMTAAAADKPDARRRALDSMSGDIRTQVERLVRA